MQFSEVFTKEKCGKHLLWLVSNGEKGIRLDLNDAELSNADLSYATLSDADLSNADLSNADLSYADLSNTNLSYANLSYANLREANLSEADLSNADLSNATLGYANLSDANLSDADLSDVDLGFLRVGNNKELITLQTGVYPAVIAKNLGVVAIGCQQHTLTTWEGFTDDEIDEMDSKALDFWKNWKHTILSIAKHGSPQ
jgi:uncharacterized protein YjbI with pentapeptide repeats